MALCKISLTWNGVWNDLLNNVEIENIKTLQLQRMKKVKALF